MPVQGITFTDPSKRSPSAERAVQDYSNKDTRNLSHATVRCTGVANGNESWHTGGTNPNAPEHLTVEFTDPNGKHVTTKHIDRNGNAC